MMWLVISLTPIEMGMAWSPIYKDILTSLLETKHRTIQCLGILCLFGMAEVVSVRMMWLAMNLTVGNLGIFMPEKHGLHRREVLVWLHKLTPSKEATGKIMYYCKTMTAVLGIVKNTLARVRVIRNFPLLWMVIVVV